MSLHSLTQGNDAKYLLRKWLLVVMIPIMLKYHLGIKKSLFPFNKQV